MTNYCPEEYLEKKLNLQRYLFKLTKLNEKDNFANQLKFGESYANYHCNFLCENKENCSVYKKEDSKNEEKTKKFNLPNKLTLSLNPRENKSLELILETPNFKKTKIYYL